jgi:acyl dehydratase
MFYAEDLAVGQRFELGSYTISEEGIVGFAKQYDPVPIHTDKDAAATGPFGGLIASGFNTLAIYQRLIVEAVWTQVAGIVGRSFRFAYPVRCDQEHLLQETPKSKASPSGQSAEMAS